jgi:hypothetical protein
MGGECVSNKYYDLFDLIEQDEEASDVYSSLPDYIQDMIDDRADNIRSVSDLKSYADNLLSGDK